MNGIPKDIITEEKVRKLKPIFERALSRKYGKEFNLKSLTLGHISVDFMGLSKKVKKEK